MEKPFMPTPPARSTAATGLFCVLASPLVWAQAQPAAPAEPHTMQTITIRGRAEQTPDLQERSQTGSRLGLSVRETPASVEVISRDTLEQRGARTLEEGLRGAVGMTVGGNPGSPGIASTRGFNGGFVSYLFDGSRISVPTMSNRPQDSWNYERIEVLKGPASVLYGEGALGGVVNFVTKRPSRQDEGTEALLAYGSHNSLRAGLGKGGPLGEKAAWRLDYSHNRSDGWIERSGHKLDHLTAGLAFDLAPTVKLDLSLDLQRDDIQAYFGTPLVPRAFAAEPTDVVSTDDGRVVDRRLSRTNYNVSDGRMDADSTWTRAKLTWQMAPRWTLRNELSLYSADRRWRNAESLSFVAPDRINRDLVDISHDHQVWSDRVDFANEGTLAGKRNRFLIGLEYAKTDFATQRRFSDGSAGTNAALQVSAVNPSVGFFNDDPALFTGAGNRTDFTADVATTSLFLEDALKLSDAWTLVAGWRSDRIKLDRTVNDLNTSTSTAFGQSYRANSGRLGTVFDLSNQTTLYAQYANATAPVGTGNLLLLSSANANFPLTRGKQVEAGLKQSLFDGRLDWTFAVYHIEQSNVLSRDPAIPAQTVNSGQISSRGIELSAAWRATKQLMLSGNLAALAARFDTLVEAGGVSRVGNTPPNVPERTANLWADYRFASMPLTVGAALSRVGHMYTNNANTVRINGHTLADVYATWRRIPATLTLRVRNLTDELYATWAGASVNNQVMLGAPRTVELTARFDF